jgi:hypothetical protein
MEHLKRWAPSVVSILGGAGLGTAITYFLGVVLVFRPGWPQWAEFFNIWGPPLVVIPISLLVGHLLGRMYVGDWLLRQEAPRRALDYAEDRLSSGILRSRREALTHRVVAARCHLYLGDYESCLQLLETGYAVPAEGRLAASIRAWRMEGWLRREEPETAIQAFDSIDIDEGTSVERARLWACRAEAAMLLEERREVRHSLENARWEEALRWRADLVEGMARARGLLHRAASGEDAWRQAEAWLRQHADDARREVPGRHMELVALRAHVAHLLGESSRSEALLSEADDCEGDERARAVLCDIHDVIE